MIQDWMAKKLLVGTFIFCSRQRKVTAKGFAATCKLQIFQQVAVGLHVYITGKFEDLLKE
jgi:hypothetical protein